MREYNRGKMIPFGAAGESDEDSVDTDGDGIPDSKDRDADNDGFTDPDKISTNDDWNDPNSPDHDQMAEALGDEVTENTFRESMEAQQERNNQFDPSDISDIPPYTSDSDNWKMHGQDRQYGDEGSWNSDAPYNDFSGSGDAGGKGYTDFSV